MTVVYGNLEWVDNCERWRWRTDYLPLAMMPLTVPWAATIGARRPTRAMVRVIVVYEALSCFVFIFVFV